MRTGWGLGGTVVVVFVEVDRNICGAGAARPGQASNGGSHKTQSEAYGGIVFKHTFVSTTKPPRSPPACLVTDPAI